MKHGVEEVQVKISALLLSMSLGSDVKGRFLHATPEFKKRECAKEPRAEKEKKS